MIASKNSRLLARIFDYFVFYIPILVIANLSKAVDGSVLMAAPMYLALTLSMLYWLFADSLPNGQSFGKKVFGIAVVNIKSDRNCSILESFIRNFVLIFAFPFSMILECLFVLLDSDRRRIGDKLAGTIVIRVR